MGNKSIPMSVKVEAVRRREAGETLRSIAQDLDASIWSIRNWHLNGIPKSTKTPDAIREQAKRRYEKGEPLRSIGEDLGVSHTTIYKWIAKDNGSSNGSQRPLTSRENDASIDSDQEYQKGREELLRDVVKAYEPSATFLSTDRGIMIFIPKEG